MSAAIEQIVETYVRLKNRRALEDMLLYRHRLAIELNSRADFDASGPIRQVDEDIAAVKARKRCCNRPSTRPARRERHEQRLVEELVA